MLSGAGESDTGRREEVFCGSVDLVLNPSDCVVYSGGLMETKASPRKCGDSPDLSSGSGVARGISTSCVVREVRRCY